MGTVAIHVNGVAFVVLSVLKVSYLACVCIYMCIFIHVFVEFRHIFAFLNF